MANTTVSVTPSAPVLAAGAPFTVTVAIAPAVAIAGAQFDLSFNPKAVQIVSVVEGNLFKQGGAPTYFMPGTIDNVNGTLKAVVGVVEGAGQSVSTPGTMVTINCTAVTAGQTSAFNLLNVIVGNPSGVAVPLASFNITQMGVASVWDLNFDGVVNQADVQIAAGHLGQTGTPGWIPSDINKDGIISVLDLILIGQNFT